MSVRYPKPEVGSLTRISAKVIPAADYFIGFLISILGVAGLAIGIPLSIAISPFFVFMVLPTIMVATMYMSLFKGTIKVGGAYDQDRIVEEANAAFDKIRGEFTEELAIPIVRKIHAHAEAGYHSGYGRCSGPCNERLTVLNQLVPDRTKPSNKDDIQQALDFIKARKELGA